MNRNLLGSLFTIPVVTLATTVFCGAPARANLIVNGGFETPAEAPGTETDFAGGSTAITGWTVLGNDVLILRTDAVETGIQFNAAEGNQSLDLTGAGNTGPTDGISQTIPTTAGIKYVLGFSVGSALGIGNSSYVLPGATDELSVNGGSLIPFGSTPVTPGFVTWTPYTYAFTATGPTTTISFYNGTPSNIAEGGLDNVSVTPVPELTSGLLAGIGCLLLSRRRRR